MPGARLSVLAECVERRLAEGGCDMVIVVSVHCDLSTLEVFPGGPVTGLLRLRLDLTIGELRNQITQWSRLWAVRYAVQSVWVLPHAVDVLQYNETVRVGQRGLSPMNHREVLEAEWASGEFVRRVEELGAVLLRGGVNIVRFDPQDVRLFGTRDGIHLTSVGRTVLFGAVYREALCVGQPLAESVNFVGRMLSVAARVSRSNRRQRVRRLRRVGPL
jgi:hypothetical protein